MPRGKRVSGKTLPVRFSQFTPASAMCRPVTFEPLGRKGFENRRTENRGVTECSQQASCIWGHYLAGSECMANPLTKVLQARKDFWLLEHRTEHAEAPPPDSRTATGSVSGRKGLNAEGSTLKRRSIHQRQDRPPEPQLTQHTGVQRRRRLHGYSCAHLGQARRHHQRGVGTGKARKRHKHARAHSGRQRSTGNARHFL